MAFVIDAPSALGQVERTHQGGARVPATLARSGLMTYYVKGRPVVHYNPPDVVAAALASAKDVPVTHNHPACRTVTVDNFAVEARGHVSSDGLVFDEAEGVAKGYLVIQDAELLRAIESNETREVSMGYDMECDATPGLTPDGQPYDVRRTHLVYNHAAVVPAGRAGRKIRLLLDAEGASILDDEEIPMKIVIDGVEVAPEQLQAKIDALCAARDALKDANTTFATDAASFEERVAAAAQKLFEKRVADDAAAAEATRAAKELADKRTLARTHFPRIADLDSKSVDYLDGLLAQVITDALPAEGTEAPLPPVAKAPAKTENDAGVQELSPRDYVRLQNRLAWQADIEPKA